jgi:hypothetical protein
MIDGTLAITGRGLTRGGVAAALQPPGFPHLHAVPRMDVRSRHRHHSGLRRHAGDAE